MKKGFVALVGMMLLSAGMLSGDTIKLRNGQEYEGKVVVRGDVYTVIQGDAVFQFQKKEVAEMNGEKLVREENPVIRIATSKGDMLVELYEDEAPNTVAIITPPKAAFTRAWPFTGSSTASWRRAAARIQSAAPLVSPGQAGRDTALRMSLRQI